MQCAEHAEQCGHIEYCFSLYTKALIVQWIIVYLLWFSQPTMLSVQSLLMYFLFYIVNNIRQLNAIIHVDSIWSLAEWIPVFRGGVHVVQMEQLDYNWTPHVLHMDSRQKIGWATTKKKNS